MTAWLEYPASVMTRAWITNSSTHVEAMVNPINAACQEGYVPDTLYMLENPGVTEAVDQAIELATAVIESYGGETPEIELTTLERDTEFDRILEHITSAIEAVKEGGGEVAVDITPGRKFMSAIAFAAGLEYDADHVYYFYIQSADFHGMSYPDMPRTAAQLYDFAEVL